MDNYFGKQDKLAYSVQCFLFQLEKRGMKRSDAVKVLAEIDIPIATHLAIAYFVSNAKNKLELNKQISLSQLTP